MKIAVLITKANANLITKLNDGVSLDPDFIDECMCIRPCYFVWDDSDSEFNELIEREEMLKKYKIEDTFITFKVSEK